jgi:hypothetical protein
MSYQIKTLRVGPKVFYHQLTVVVKLSVPAGATIRNPNGSTSYEFKMPATGTHIHLDFRVDGDSSATATTIERVGILSPITSTGSGHKTTVNMLASGSVKDSKSKTQAQYEVDPPFIEEQKQT